MGLYDRWDSRAPQESNYRYLMFKYIQHSCYYSYIVLGVGDHSGGNC